MGVPSTPKIEKLKDDNWFSWEAQISIVLECYRALKVATGMLPKPSDPEGAAIWSNQDLIAKSLVANSIANEQTIHISKF